MSTQGGETGHRRPKRLRWNPKTERKDEWVDEHGRIVIEVVPLERDETLAREGTNNEGE